MIRLSIICAMASFLMLAGCNSPTQVDTGGQFLPLNVGNKWYYNTNNAGSPSDISEVWEITGIKTINGIKYYQLDINTVSLNAVSTIYYRYGGDTLFYRYSSGGEFVAADFSLQLNDTAYWDKNITVTKKTKDMISYTVPLMGDYSYSATYSRGLGMTYMEESGFVYYYRKLLKADLK